MVSELAKVSWTSLGDINGAENMGKMWGSIENFDVLPLKEG